MLGAENIPFIQGGKMTSQFFGTNGHRKLAVPAAPLDFTVRVDRSMRSKGVLYPRLARVGPREYDLRYDTELWSFSGQGYHSVFGTRILHALEQNQTLFAHLGIADGEAIRAKGSAVFHALYGHRNRVLLWKSVFQITGEIYVPCLFLSEAGMVEFGRVRMRENFGPLHLALKFKSESLGRWKDDPGLGLWEYV
jgi:hypothetical protein